MLYWNIRERLSPSDKLRRSYYELLRDELDQFMVKYSLIDSYNNFLKKNIPYPFVEKRELKPRAIIPDFEYEAQNAFLVVFVEDSIPNKYKKYIRFFDVNKTTKANLLRTKTLPLSKNFDRYQKYLESAHFFDFLNVLLPVDYALLIQRDTATKKNRYSLSHFHVRIDWPIADAAEDMAKELRYISKDLYEKGDKYAEDVQKKFFEYYGLPLMVGGRRTAACVAAQFLKQVQCITTVYAGSSETRALIRLSERGVAKMVLMKLEDDEIRQLVENKEITIRSFKDNYVVARKEKTSICIFQTIYSHTNHALPPEDGRMREIKPDLYWLSVGIQQILPIPGIWEYPPIEYNIIYS